MKLPCLYMLLNPCFFQKWYGGIPTWLRTQNPPVWVQILFLFCFMFLNILFALFRTTKNDKSALRFICPCFQWLFDLFSCSLSAPQSPAFCFLGWCINIHFQNSNSSFLPFSFKCYKKMLRNVCIATSVFFHILFHPLHFSLNPNSLTRSNAMILGVSALSVGRIYTSTNCGGKLVKQCWNCSPMPNHSPYTPYEEYFSLCAIDDV